MYNDYKALFPIRVTNGPAEAVNKIIKRVRQLCIRPNFFTLRAKLIHGEFFVQRRPPHPLDPVPLSKRGVILDAKPEKAKRVKKQPSAKANTERLRRACEARDKTHGLIQTPMDHDGYSQRFKNLESHELNLGTVIGKNAKKESRKGGRPAMGSQYPPVKAAQSVDKHPEQLVLF